MVRVIAWVKGHQYQWYRREYRRISNIAILLFLPLGAAMFTMAQLGYKELALIFWGLLVASGAIAIVLLWVDKHEKKLAN